MATLKIEIADNPVALAQGLMGRQKLAADAGMLFKFPMILEASFWGKNTYIPLDVAFIDANDIITEIQPIVPLSTKAVRSGKGCSMAVEANAGFFRENGIKVGDKVNLNDEGTEISFV